MELHEPTAKSADDQRARLRAEVAFGHDFYLFYRGDDSFEQVCDASTLDDLDAWRLVTRLQARFDWCAQRGIAYIVLIVPEKSVIYADKLPPDRTISLRRPVSRLLTLVSPTMRHSVLYPEADLRLGRATLPTYFRTDSHWSRWGAYLGYRSLVARINQQLSGRPGLLTLPPVAETDLVMTEDQLIGDLGVRLDSEPVETFQWVRPRAPLRFRKRSLTESFAGGRVDLFEHDEAALPRAVVFRSSNGTHLIDPFLASHVSRLVAVTGPHKLFADLVTAERPDCVISEIPERYLAIRSPPGSADKIGFPNGLDHDFTAETGLKLPLPRIFDRP